MVETKAKKAAAPKAAAAPSAAAAKGSKGAKTVPQRKGSNYDLGGGVYRFSKATQYHKKGLWKFMGKKTEKQVKPKKAITVVKPIGGDKNGGSRVVLLKKRKAFYPTANSIRTRTHKKYFSEHTRYTRASVTPGTVCILLAGRHKGKRVVVMKVLKSGLVLVNGPFTVNQVPLRRVHQNFIIATSTKIDISSVQLPEKLNDDYFRRQRPKRAKKGDGDIFTKTKEKFKPSEERKKDQKEVDKQLLKAIAKHPEKVMLTRYLRNTFGLRTMQYPHRMKF